MMMASPSDACTYSDDQFVMGGCIVKYVNIVLVHKVNGVQAFGVKMCIVVLFKHSVPPEWNVYS